MVGGLTLTCLRDGTATKPGKLPGRRLDHVSTDGPVGASAIHSSYRVRKGDAVFGLSRATTDPAAESPVLLGIASSLRVL